MENKANCVSMKNNDTINSTLSDAFEENDSMEFDVPSFEIADMNLCHRKAQPLQYLYDRYSGKSSYERHKFHPLYGMCMVPIFVYHESPVLKQNRFCH